MAELPQTIPAGLALQQVDQALGPPPPDVQHLLQLEGVQLPHYFDAQQAAAVRRSHDQWPCLWHLAPATP